MSHSGTMPRDAPALWPKERLLDHAGLPALTYFRQGRSDTLVVFVTGSGHLARVAYGAPTAQASDFLDFWLEEAGYSLLAVSHPSEHPVFPRVFPDMTVRDWAELVAEATRTARSEIGGNCSVVAVVWSMGGRIVSSLNRAAQACGFDLDCCIALSGTAPLPGLLPTPKNDAVGLTPSGLWDPFSPRIGWAWQAALEEQHSIAGHPVVDILNYRRDYCGATPIRLRGGTRTEAARFPLEDVADDLGAFDYRDYPVVAAIRPTRASDAIHALTDRETWGFLNAQKITFDWLAEYLSGTVTLSPDHSLGLASLMDTVPSRLTRSVDGGHLFFLGQPGARATVAHIAELQAEVEALRNGFASILTGGARTR